MAAHIQPESYESQVRDYTGALVKASDVVQGAPGKSLLVPGPLTELSTDQLNNVVALGVARTEDMIQQNLTRLQREIKKIEKELSHQTKTLETAAIESGIRAMADNVESLNLALRRAQATHVAKTLASCNVHEQTTFVAIELQPREKRYRNEDRELVIKSENIEFTSGQKAMAEELKVLEARLNTLREGAIGWKQKLGEMGSIERKARARIAEHQLEKTDEGRDILAKLESKFLVDTTALLTLAE